MTYQGCAAEGVGAAQPNGSTLRRVRGQGCAASSLAPLAHETAYSSMASYKYTGYNKASPLGASLYNTYKNNNIPTGAGAYAYAREILPKTLSLYSCGGRSFFKKPKKVARVFGRFRGYIWRA